MRAAHAVGFLEGIGRVRVCARLCSRFGNAEPTSNGRLGLAGVHVVIERAAPLPSATEKVSQLHRVGGTLVGRSAPRSCKLSNCGAEGLSGRNSSCDRCADKKTMCSV